MPCTASIGMSGTFGSWCVLNDSRALWAYQEARTSCVDLVALRRGGVQSVASSTLVCLTVEVLAQGKGPCLLSTAALPWDFTFPGCCPTCSAPLLAE